MSDEVVESSSTETSTDTGTDSTTETAVTGADKGSTDTSTTGTKAVGSTGTSEDPIAKIQKNYDNLRSWADRTSGENAQLRKQMEALGLSTKQIMDLLAKATEKPYTPEEFKKDFETKGPDALKPYIEKMLGELRTGYDKKIGDAVNATKNMENRYEVALRWKDDENYPNFSQMWPQILELIKQPNCPIDCTQPTGRILDAAYKLVVSQSSNAAVKEAVELGKKQKEGELRKEAATSVTGGGKKGSFSVHDLEKMDLSKLEEHIGTLER